MFAGLLGGATYPQAALAKAWVQLAYGAHHDAITGSESDQVYLDLLTGWRDAWELGSTARDNALRAAVQCGRRLGRGVERVGAQTHRCRDGAALDDPLGPARAGVRLRRAPSCPRTSNTAGRSVSWLARDVPSLGWQSYRLAAGRRTSTAGNRSAGNEIANEHYRLRVDPARGGGVSSLIEVASGRELIADGGSATSWPSTTSTRRIRRQARARGTCCPRGRSSARRPSRPRCRRTAAPLGERLVVRGRIGDLLRYTQTLTLWHGVARVDCRTTVDEFTGADRLLRLRWPCPVPGALPVSEVGDAVIGRGFGLMHDRGREEAVDSAKHPWTLDNPAYGWFGLSSAARVRVRGADARRATPCRACRVAEVVVADRAGVGTVGPRPHGRARPRRRHRHLQRRRQAAVRRSRPSTPTCPTRGSRSADRTETPSPQRFSRRPTPSTPRN